MLHLSINIDSYHFILIASFLSVIKQQFCDVNPIRVSFTLQKETNYSNRTVNARESIVVIKRDNLETIIIV